VVPDYRFLMEITGIQTLFSGTEWLYFTICLYRFIQIISYPVDTMDVLAKLKERNTLIIMGILVILFVVMLYIRVLPLLNLGTTDILNIVGSDDPLYNLRQTEQVIANYPTYAWFDAMTLFPTGQNVPWGPLLIWMTSTLSILAGASTRNEIIGVALWVPPLLAAFMVPVTFLLVRKIWDWKAGIAAAVFIAFIGGQFFFRSFAGYLDHHVAEVLFSTIFILAYIYALGVIWKNPVDFKKRETLKKPLIYAVIAGIAYIFGLLAMPTIILFAIIVSIFTIIIFLLETWHNKPAGGMVILNTVVFGLAAIAVALLHIPDTGLGLYIYSYGQVIAYLLLIAGTAILYLLAEYFRQKHRFFFPLAILVLILVTIGGMAVLLPDLYGSFFDGLLSFFGFSSIAITIQEARPWTLAEAWQTYNFGLLLMAGGFLVLLYQSLKKYRAEHLFILVWAVLIIIAAFREVRYEYYLAAIIAVLAGICVAYTVERAWPDIVKMGRRSAVKEPEEPPKEERGSAKKKKADKASQKATKKTVSKPKANYLNILIAGIVLALALIFVVTSVTLDYQVASSGAIRMNPDWRESLEWMNTGTPETGVDYYAIYDKATFTYPDTAYGVMSWWDYGHMITYIAKRIPNANPFQAGVAGPNGAAAFFMTQDEDGVNAIADHQGTRYVVTDIEMDTGKFWAMATWYNSSVGAGPYQQIFLVPDNPVSPTGYDQVTVYTDKYFQTMVSRLHNFDGSMATAGQVYYIEYTTTSGVGPYPVITNVEQLDAAEARAKAEQYNRNAQTGYHAEAVSTILIMPVDTVPALHHYRLVHESPTNVFGEGSPADLKYVKVFEYVPGARIRGEGIIELPVVTNTGRQFTWRAESEDGVFIVPYATEGNPYDVRAAGKYRIAGTGQEFSVSEDAIMSGASIT
jgi:oligosaccharyl transferase (archaeosortase A-associated)